MTLEKSQDKTGFERKDSPNDVNFTGGRGEGDEGGQKKIGHLREISNPDRGQEGPDDGFRETQGKQGFTKEQSLPDKSAPGGGNGNPERIDKISEISN